MENTGSREGAIEKESNGACENGLLTILTAFRVGLILGMEITHSQLSPQ